jgi:hypothetical protein
VGAAWRRMSRARLNSARFVAGRSGASGHPTT